MRLFARAGDHRAGDFATSEREVRQFIRAYPDHNIYVAPNPTCSTVRTRHTNKEVTHWSYLLVDMDPVCLDRKAHGKKCDVCWRTAEPREALEEALLWLGEWVGRNFTRGGRNPQQPIIIHSGRGCQAWIRLEDIVLDDVTPSMTIHALANDDITWAVRRSVARRVNGYWLKRLSKKLGVIRGCQVDTTVSDLPRVMRCPGTVNTASKQRATILHATSHVFTGLAHLLVTGTPVAELEDPPPPRGVVPGQSWQMVYNHLTKLAQDYLRFGAAEGGRHKAMWHTAKKLQELGVSRGQAQKALTWANGLKGEDERLQPEEIKHALDTAYGS